MQELLRLFAFNTIVNIPKKELEALRQRLNESVTSFISRWREKITFIVDRPSKRYQICVIMRSLQPRYVRHLMGSTHADFGSLVQALYNVQESISQEVWPKSSLSDSKIKKSSGGQSLNVGIISTFRPRLPRYKQSFPQTFRAHSPYTTHPRYQYKSSIPSQAYDRTYQYSALP